jgi:hypothetical protein
MNKIFNDEQRCGNCDHAKAILPNPESDVYTTILLCGLQSGGQPPESLRLGKQPSFERDPQDVCGNYEDLNW